MFIRIITLYSRFSLGNVGNKWDIKLRCHVKRDCIFPATFPVTLWAPVREGGLLRSRFPLVNAKNHKKIVILPKNLKKKKF